MENKWPFTASRFLFFGVNESLGWQRCSTQSTVQDGMDVLRSLFDKVVTHGSDVDKVVVRVSDCLYQHADTLLHCSLIGKTRKCCNLNHLRIEQVYETWCCVAGIMNNCERTIGCLEMIIHSQWCVAVVAEVLRLHKHKLCLNSAGVNCFWSRKYWAVLVMYLPNVIFLPAFQLSLHSTWSGGSETLPPQFGACGKINESVPMVCPGVFCTSKSVSYTIG